MGKTHMFYSAAMAPELSSHVSEFCQYSHMRMKAEFEQCLLEYSLFGNDDDDDDDC